MGTKEGENTKNNKIALGPALWLHGLSEELATRAVPWKRAALAPVVGHCFVTQKHPLSFSQKCIPFFYCLYAIECKLGMVNEKAETPMDGSGFDDGVKV